MELILRLQDGGYQKSGNQIVYDPTAVCYTRVPHSLKRLLHQRDRWHRGLMDCLIKHRNMIANPRYGMLGLATMSYQLVVELLVPVFWVVYACLLMWEKSFPFLSMAFAGYVVAQFGLTVISAYIDVDKNMRRLLKTTTPNQALNHSTKQTTPERVERNKREEWMSGRKEEKKNGWKGKRR